MERELLRSAFDRSEEGEYSAEDVVFVLALEPYPSSRQAPLWERVLNWCIKNFQEAPEIWHVELALPRSSGERATEDPQNFATYMFDRAEWRGRTTENEDYYIRTTGGHWLAVPVRGENILQRVKDVCNLCDQTPYSMFRYLTSSILFRSLSWMLSTDLSRPAHCANLTARVLCRARKDGGERDSLCLKHCSAWYSPSSLWNELNLHSATDPPLSFTAEPTLEVARAEYMLLHGSTDDLQKCDRGSAYRALLCLGSAACDPALDAKGRREAQLRCGRAVMRFGLYIPN